LSTAGKQAGGLWAAAGTLGAGTSSVRLALLSILFSGAGLPSPYQEARLVIWLKQEGHYDAVRAAMALEWSSGQTEGQINRLKTIKRAMYGRAGLDLLERRFLLAA